MIFNFKSTSDAKTLDGHGAEYFAAATALANAMKSYQYVNAAVNNDDELNAALQSLHDSAVNSSHYQTMLNIGYGSLFSGGYKWVEGCRQVETYGWQKVTSWSNGSPREYWRSLYAGTWTEWAEVANHNKYLSLDGGGEVKASVPTPIQVNNTGDNVKTLFGFLNKGVLQGYIGFNGKDKPFYQTSTGGENELLHTGNMASYALPKNGGGEVKAQTRQVITVNTENEGEGASTVQFKLAGTALGELGVSKSNGAFFREGTANYKLHHDGNSAKVVINQTAPSDNTTLWVY